MNKIILTVVVMASVVTQVCFAAESFHNYGVVRLWGISGFPEMFGASVSLDAARPFKLETGIGANIVEGYATIKAGGAIPLKTFYSQKEKQKETADGLLELTPFIGYRAISDDEEGGFSYNAFIANVSLDYTGKPAADFFGFNIQCLLGVMTYQDFDGYSVYSPEIRIAAGVAF